MDNFAPCDIIFALTTTITLDLLFMYNLAHKNLIIL